MPVDSERKTYAPRLGCTAMGWLATQSMEAYSLWMAWLHQPDLTLQQQIKELTPEHCRAMIRQAYQRDKADKQRS